MPRKNSNKLLPDGNPNPDYIRAGGKSGIANNRKRTIDGEKNPDYKRKSGKHKPAFLSGEFVGVDGEGEEVNGVHQYTYLADNASSIYNPRGLTSIQCFDHLLQMGYKNQKGIFCIFSGGYDMNLWIRDLDKETIQNIVEADGQYFVNWKGYRIKFVQRRFFEIARQYRLPLPNGGIEKPVKIWDVWGFFQGSFINAIKQWIPAYDKLDLIIEGKKRRIDFHGSDYEFMVDYNAAELEALVMMMEKLREVMIEMGLTLRGWHGAGAIASAIYKKHEVKKYLEKPPENIYQASKHAYFGGRIEIGQYGYHKGTIHHYDVNSSYPAKQLLLPALAGGEWINRGAGFDTRTTDNICIALVQWSDIYDTVFCPFPYRSLSMRRVMFPDAGINWIYKPELDAALKWQGLNYHWWKIDIQECWEFIPADDYKPFHFIAVDYLTRQKIVAESKRTGIPNGTEKGIKAGLNSLYGKTSQRVGYDPKTGRIPPFHNLVYAGYITSASRAELFDAAMQAPDKIICMATDGIYSTVPLELDCPADKILGKWEYQKHDGMMLVQSGFYFLFDGDKISSYSRGFDRMTERAAVIEAIDMIKTAWKKKHFEVYLPCTRFVTIKSALAGGDWWSRWCTWYKYKMVDKKTGAVFEGRRLAITPHNTKRVISEKGKAELQMIQTMPESNFVPQEMSLQHDIPWDVDEDKPENEPSVLDIVLEHGDGEI